MPASEERNGDDAADSVADDEATPRASAGHTTSKFFIVGVGASAGGLEALTGLLAKARLDRMAIVMVQHLAPKHESLLPTLLSRISTVEVVAATDGTKVAPNHVYVIPPNADLAILQGTLHVMTPQRIPLPHGPHLPVDYFFRSLAADQGARSIGIVLSGTGSDGTFGLRAIKEAGGITFAQDPVTAKYGGMPRSAFESGWADFCLPPDGIARGAGQHQPASVSVARQAVGDPGAGRRVEAHRPHARRVRQRPQLLQADHRRAAHRAPDGAPQDREAG